ncbi:hypothetical protein JZ751_009951 [Albula glossodonta]|uniref:Uncharacterized protein n=1 Tax=Albula glossodonta TaxID=121402 RepID=A0A8T2NZ24_9TELE|nr:hypothetical protein JZ751_009951 [Albula glossodonta]
MAAKKNKKSATQLAVERWTSAVQLGGGGHYVMTIGQDQCLDVPSVLKLKEEEVEGKIHRRNPGNRGGKENKIFTNAGQEKENTSENVLKWRETSVFWREMKMVEEQLAE